MKILDLEIDNMMLKNLNMTRFLSLSLVKKYLIFH